MHTTCFRLTTNSRLWTGALRTHTIGLWPGQRVAGGVSIPQSSGNLVRRSFTGFQRLHSGFNSRLTYRSSVVSFSTPKRWLSTSPKLLLRYHVPQPRQRKPSFLGFLDKIPGNTVFFGIIGLNAAVFAMWFMAIQKYKQEGDASAIFWMEQNFLNSWKNLTSGRIWTPLTACFSHRDWSHILLNGFTFYFMAPTVLQLIGSRQFIFLYMGGGLVASFASMTYAKLSGKNNYASHGASGAIYSIVTLLACVAPTLTFHLYGIIPVPAWLAVTGLFSYDLYSTLSAKNGTTDTVGHIGGIVAGIGYFVIRRFGLF